MAKKKINQNSKDEQKKWTPDMELLTHQYSDFYNKPKEQEANSLVSREDENDDNEYFEWYDTREVFYPVYKTKISYEIIGEQEIHPVIIELLKIIKELEKLKDRNTISKLQEITQLDNEIFGSIVADLVTKALIVESKEKKFLSLTNKGKEALKKQKEKIKEQTSAFVSIDGIFGDIQETSKISKEIYLESKANKEAIELKPQSATRPRFENLNESFGEEESNKTLRQVLMESLNHLDNKEGQKYEVSEILDISNTKKFYKKYWCLFYKGNKERERILVINEQYERDPDATELFDKLIDTSNFKPSNKSAEEYKENIEKFKALIPELINENKEINLENGHTIEVKEHKKYFLYILDNAKKAVYIQSPWIRYKILEYYKEKLESCLEKGVKVYIKYGMKPRNKSDKAGIDKEAKEYLQDLRQKYPQLFSLKEDDDHSKILICDDEFMIMGSFNWLSFGGEDRDGENPRGEASAINKNQDSIKKGQGKFKATK